MNQRIEQSVKNIADIARMCHEVNRAYCQAIGDTLQPSWEASPEWQRKSCINGVEFHLTHPDAKPEDSHVNWMKEKTAEGWEFGPVKDPDKKQHPCMIPYEQLPLEQRVKDALFIAVVHAMPKVHDMVIEDVIPLEDKPAV